MPARSALGRRLSGSLAMLGTGHSPASGQPRQDTMHHRQGWGQAQGKGSWAGGRGISGVEESAAGNWALGQGVSKPPQGTAGAVLGIGRALRRFRAGAVSVRPDKDHKRVVSSSLVLHVKGQCLG